MGDVCNGDSRRLRSLVTFSAENCWMRTTGRVSDLFRPECRLDYCLIANTDPLRPAPSP